MAKLNYLPERQVESEKPEPSVQSQFNYAWGLLKSDDEDDNKQGINILTDIFKNIPARRRECLYYLTIGCFKIGEYEDAKRYVEALLIHEPDNHQAIQLKMAIENKISKGMFILISFLFFI
ncbi:hypothetical protein B5S28_g1865 [[Candida] boidinii]|nr:hypothetical protein B5S28_g1865 [[Candida] boidinii]OWB61716.1 hypothetical protein B5S29_g2619 [[Candida] boidinii]OWB70727.1 hypothetical protein B5S31_g406 [[Candida] boidinii]OWB76163.1 hypothetical protein B5S32_g313 [[Candida] boidinii]